MIPVNRVTDFVKKSMSYSLLNKEDPRNLLKKCPKCGLVWLKVSGCEGETICGNRSMSNSEIKNE